MKTGEFNFPRGKELIQIIVQLFFVAVCFAMFIRYGVKFDTGNGYREIILMLTGTTFLLFFFIKIRKIFLEHILFFLCGIFIIISFLVSDIKSFGIAEIFAFFTVISTIFIISQIDSKKIKYLTWGLVLIAAVASLYGLIKFTYQPDPRVISNFTNPLDPVQGFPNALALFLLILWPYAADKMVNSKSRLQKTFNIFFFGLILAALYLTYSRGAYLAFGIQLIILAVFNYKYFLKNRIKWIAGILISIILITGTLYIRTQNNFETSDIGQKITFGNEESLTSIDERLHFFRITTGLVFEKPLFGHGPQSFRFIYPSKQELLYANSDHPHNIFLKYAFENGVIVALLLIGIFISLGIKSIRKITPQKDFISIAVAGGLAHNIIDYNLNFLLIYVVFAITIGILINILGSKKTNIKSKIYNTLSKILFYIFFILILLLSAIGIRDYLKTDPYSDFETIKRYTEEEMEMHTSKYSKSFYPREFWIQLSDYYLLKSDFNKALEMIEKHIELNPHDKYGFLNKGRILHELGRYDEAISALNKAIELDSKNLIAIHYYYLNILKAANQKVPEEYLERTLYPILDDFMYYAEHNLHHVSMKPEIEYAQFIMDLLKKSEDKYRDWDYLSEELNSFAEKYRKKS